MLKKVSQSPFHAQYKVSHYTHWVQNVTWIDNVFTSQTHPNTHWASTDGRYIWRLPLYIPDAPWLSFLYDNGICFLSDSCVIDLWIQWIIWDWFTKQTGQRRLTTADFTSAYTQMCGLGYCLRLNAATKAKTYICSCRIPNSHCRHAWCIVSKLKVLSNLCLHSFQGTHYVHITVIQNAWKAQVVTCRASLHKYALLFISY